MGKREFVSLTDDEVKQIVKDIFSAEKVTCIKRYKRDGEIHCSKPCFRCNRWNKERPG